MYCDDIMSIFIENATSLAERREIMTLTESESLKINNEMVARLFNSALNKRFVDFADIPDSKGDITRYSGYNSMIECIGLMKDIIDKSGSKKIDEIEIVDKAISNIIANRDVFEKGFKLNKDFIILQYNIMVASCVASTSALIVSYIDYVKTINKVEFKIINNKYSMGQTCIDGLKSFNESVASGDFTKVTSAVIKSGVVKEGVGTVAAIGAGIIFGSVLLVKLIRQLVFYFYYSKQNISDYLKLQASFLEMNKNNIAANSAGVPAATRNNIMEKQSELIKKLNKYSDKLKVDIKLTENKANTELKKENSSWKINDVKTDVMNSSDGNSFNLL